MAIEISILQPLSENDSFSFILSNAVTGYSKYIAKYFVAFAPSIIEEIELSGTNNLLNLYNNLQANNSDSNTTFTLDGSKIVMNVPVFSGYMFMILSNFSNKFLLVETSTDVVPTPTFPTIGPFGQPFDVTDFSIEIIDTYDNNRPLIVEQTAVGSPKMQWDAGDDLYANLMTSSLIFNMLVPEADDAHFFHLLTGDEKRFLVKLSTFDAQNSPILVWQGYLLPDLYKEPYSNGVFFVEFTATDMLGAMKGKRLEPCYFCNNLPIAEVLALCLQSSGLNQPLLVQPSLVPQSNNWREINVPMDIYFDEKKYTDNYEILNDILKAQCLTLYSFNGAWWLVGFSRKGNVSGAMSYFDYKGIFQSEILFTNAQKKSLIAFGPPNITAVVPWKSVEIECENKGEKNIFSDTVVLVETKGQYATDRPETDRDSAFMQINNHFLQWNKIGMSGINTAVGVAGNAFYYFVQNSASYTSNESSSLANYFKCPENPTVTYLMPYKLNFEIEVTIKTNDTRSVFEAKLKNNDFDKLVYFQVFIDNSEILSNRPSFINLDSFGFIKYKTTIKAFDENIGYEVLFVIDRAFIANLTGVLSLRILQPAGSVAAFNMQNMGFYRPLKLSITYDEKFEYRITDEFIAKRPVAFTTEKKYDIALTANLNSIVKNSFGIGFPINPNYDLLVARDINNRILYGFNFSFIVPGNLLVNPIQSVNQPNDVNFNAWVVTAFLFDIIFFKEKKRALYKKNTVTLEKKQFFKVWGQFKVLPPTSYNMSIITDFLGNPDLPKFYENLETLFGYDELYLFYVQYVNENLLNRDKWKIFGSNVIQTYNKTVAKIVHGMQPQTIFKIEATSMDMMLPNQLLSFEFYKENRNFILTRLTLDLSEGKTEILGTEAKFTELTDIIYE